MKRIWAALILLVLTLAACTVGILHTRRVAAQMIGTVTMAREAEAVGDMQSAKSLSEQAIGMWRENHKFMCTYMMHSSLQEIDQTLSALPSLSTAGESSQFFAECDKGIAQLSYLDEAEIPNIENIF